MGKQLFINTFRRLRGFFIFLMIIPVKIYQYIISPFLPGSCRFQPTCSEYAIQALRTRGVITGLYLSVRRILRCHPFGGHGYDPVPPPGTGIFTEKWLRFKNRIRKPVKE